VREKSPFIFCIQETKYVNFDDSMCTSIWGDVNVGYSFQPSLGALGGLVTLWDSSEVEVWLSISFEHVLVIGGGFTSQMSSLLCSIFMLRVMLLDNNLCGIIFLIG